MSNDVLMYLVTDAFTDVREWVTIDINDMKVVGPAILGDGTYKAVSGRVLKIDENGNVVDDTDAWNRAAML